jgi:DNA-binding MarR family transcriptional regulator
MIFKSSNLTNFGIIYREYVQFINELLKESQLTFADSIFLCNIAVNSGCSQEDISLNLHIDRAAVARSIKKMEECGFVLVSRDKNDSRKKILELSDNGKKLYEMVNSANEERLSTLLKGCSQKNAEIFFSVLETCAKNSVDAVGKIKSPCLN